MSLVYIGLCLFPVIFLTYKEPNESPPPSVQHPITTVQPDFCHFKPPISPFIHGPELTVDFTFIFIA